MLAAGGDKPVIFNVSIGLNMPLAYPVIFYITE